MKFRIQSLMIEIVMISFLLAVWHLAPKARWVVLPQMVATYALNVPFQIYSRKHPGPWSENAMRWYAVYCVMILGGDLATIFLFPSLPEVMASWPG